MAQNEAHNKKRILLIMTTLFAGGAEKQYRYIMEGLSAHMQVDVLLLNRPIPGQEQQTERYIQAHPNICFHQMPGSVFQPVKSGLSTKLRKIRSLFLQRLWLGSFLRKNRVDVAMFSYVTQLLMLPLLHRHRVKAIFNERNTGRQLCDSRYKIRLLQACDRVISNSKYAADYIREHTGIHVEVFHNGLKLDTLQHQAHEGFHILVPARINPIKNQLVLIRALARLRQERPGLPDIRVTLAGEVESSEYSKQLRALIEQHSLPVEMPGFVSDAKELFARSDLVVLPSFEEGTPNVLLEAYMYRLMPLVSDIPMNRDCCIFKEILFDPKDERGLADKLVQCIQGNPFATREFFDANYRFFEEHFSLESMQMHYLRLIAELE